ncbi:hypothetical protein PIB30_098316 [Stylosanthes scabra]|uniref:Uncharacterized protein n=1 Tax=Stylosanthes scabra TaxID=79078 RepID=A0ABU6RXA8_9FABA|nr:hypothetical protein [Stylosanthes scabra]
MIDASSGGALMNKTPDEAWELIETMTDNNQHFKTRATTTTKGVFEVAPSGSTILAKSLVKIATMLKEIKEGQQIAPKILTQQPTTSQQMPIRHCGTCSIKHSLKGGVITNKTDGAPPNNSNQLNTASNIPTTSCKIHKTKDTNLCTLDKPIL